MNTTKPEVKFSNERKIILFKYTGEEFSAWEKAKQWATENGYEIGSMQRSNPIGIHKDAEYISKWTNMTKEEQDSLDGRMESNCFRNSDVAIILKVVVP